MARMSNAERAAREAARRQEEIDRKEALREYQEAKRELLKSGKSLDYRFEGIRSTRYMNAEEIRQETEELKKLRKEMQRQEIERTRGEAKAGGYKGVATYDNVKAIMDATDESMRDTLRDIIESNYDELEVAADLLNQDDEELYYRWIESYGNEEEVAELWEEGDFDLIF